MTSLQDAWVFPILKKHCQAPKVFKILNIENHITINNGMHVQNIFKICTKKLYKISK